MDIKMFVRRPPEPIQAVQVTSKNMQEIAVWVGGRVQTVGEQTKAKFVKVKVKHPLSDRQTKAFVGDWVLSGPTGFKVYTPKAFEENFEPVVISELETDPIEELRVVDVPADCEGIGESGEELTEEDLAILKGGQ